MKEEKSEELLANFEEILANLHKEERPDYFGDLAVSLGWKERQLPPNLTRVIMEKILLSQEEVFLSKKVIKGIILIFLSIFITFFMVAEKLLKQSEVDYSMLLGMFWVVVSFSSCLGLILVCLYIYEKNIGRAKEIRGYFN